MKKKGILFGIVFVLVAALAIWVMAAPSVTMQIDMDAEFEKSLGTFVVSIRADNAEDAITAEVTIEEDGKLFRAWEMEGTGTADKTQIIVVKGGSTYTMTVEPTINGEKQAKKTMQWVCPVPQVPPIHAAGSEFSVTIPGTCTPEWTEDGELVFLLDGEAVGGVRKIPYKNAGVIDLILVDNNPRENTHLDAVLRLLTGKGIGEIDYMASGGGRSDHEKFSICAIPWPQENKPSVKYYLYPKGDMFYVLWHEELLFGGVDTNLMWDSFSLLKDAWGTMYHEGTGSRISLGMTRAEVEAQLGETELPDPADVENAMAWMDRYGAASEDHIIVFYDTEREDVVEISLQSDNYYGKTNWCLAGGIKKGATEEEILAVYGSDPAYYHREENRVALGDDPEDKSQMVGLLYCYDAEHQLMERVPPMDDIAYMVHFSLKGGALDTYSVMSTEYFDLG